MDVTHEMTSTLRAEAHHPPCIMGASGFCTEHSADSRSIGYREEESPTLRAGITPGVAIEFNPTDSRIRVRDDGICQTLCSRMGTSGNNVPLVFGISADQSNAMLSDNPHSGIYEAETSRTLDCNGGSPCCNQGGMMVVTPVQDASFAPNTVDRQAVCAMNVGFFVSTEEMTPALLARDWKDPPVVGRPAGEYLVRRLTPDECCRLQGYPDGWCKDLENHDPSEEEILLWTEIFREWDAVNGKPDRVRSRKAIVKWLSAPGSDAAEYKAYGNSVAVPCVFFVLAGIVWAQDEEVKS